MSKAVNLLRRSRKMAGKQNERHNLALKLDTLTDGEVKELLDYVSFIESFRRGPVSAGLRDDEVINSLADSVENRRARQAYEWETARRKAERRAAAVFSRT
jgi:hypothetical protein